MQFSVRSLFVLTIFLAGSAAGVRAQTRNQTNISFGGGLLVADHAPGGAGISAFVRVGLPRLPLLLDASLLSAPGGPSDPPVFCPGGCAGGLPYTGANTALSLSPAIQVAEGGLRAAMLYRLGPTVSWLADRAPGSASVVGGFRAGISFRFGEGNSGLLLSGDYFRLLRGDTAPRWFLPITIGWQF